MSREEDFLEKRGITRRRIKEKLPKKELHKLYWNERKSTIEIAKRYNVTKGTINFLMKEYKIPARETGRYISWKDWEVDILEKYYPDINQIQKEVNRSELGIKNKARSLGFFVRDQKETNMDLDDFSLGYLVGIIEGEGCVTLRSVGAGKVPVPHITIANTDPNIIDRVNNILNQAGFKAYKNRTMSGGKRGKRKKALIVETVSSLRSGYEFLKAIREYLHSSKREVADLILKFCESRLEKSYLPPRKKRLTQKEEEIIKEVKRINNS